MSLLKNQFLQKWQTSRWPEKLRLRYARLMFFLCGKRGFKQFINGTDHIIIPGQLKIMSEAYEPQAWRILLSQIRQGDIAVDIGAYVGLYSVALARRAGASGRVFAFEPDPYNYAWLKWVIGANNVGRQVELSRCAVAGYDGKLDFINGCLSCSHVLIAPEKNASSVSCVRLDTFFKGRPINILKIDVEGYEEQVLKGCQEILADPSRRPRCILIECHHYAWKQTGTTMEGLLGLLNMYKCEQIGINNINEEFDNYRSGLVCRI